MWKNMRFWRLQVWRKIESANTSRNRKNLQLWTIEVFVLVTVLKNPKTSMEYCLNFFQMKSLLTKSYICVCILNEDLAATCCFFCCCWCVFNVHSFEIASWRENEVKPPWKNINPRAQWFWIILITLHFWRFRYENFVAIFLRWNAWFVESTVLV